MVDWASTWTMPMFSFCDWSQLPLGPDTTIRVFLRARHIGNGLIVSDEDAILLGEYMDALDPLPEPAPKKAKAAGSKKKIVPAELARRPWLYSSLGLDQKKGNWWRWEQRWWWGR